MKRIIHALVLGGSFLLSGTNWGSPGIGDCPRRCESICMHSAVGAEYGPCLARCMAMCMPKTPRCENCHNNMWRLDQLPERPVVEVQFFEREAPRNFLEGYEQALNDDA